MRIIFWLFLLAFLTPKIALADACFAAGAVIKCIKPAITLGSGGSIYTGTVDPSSTATSGNKGDIYLYGGSSPKLLQKQDAGSSTNWTAFSAGSSAVSSVFGRTGAVVATSGDYSTNLVTENTNLYFTNARAIAATLTGYSSGAGTVSSSDTILQAIQKINGNDALKSPAFPAIGTTRYVYASLGGTDAVGCGTPVNPCATVSYSLSLITDASSTKRYILHLGPGSFTESSDLTLKPWVWIVGEQYYATRLAVTGGTNTIGLDNAFASGGSRAGFKDIYLSGSTKLNLDLQALTNSGTPSFVFEAEHIWMNSTFTFKGRNATGQFDSFEIYDAFFLGNAVIEAGEANEWNVVQLGTTTITSTNGASSNTFVNGSYVGATTITGNNTYSSVNQFQASGQGTSLTATGAQDLYLDGISSVAGFVPAANVTLHCTDGSGCGQLVRLNGATAGTNAVINFKDGHIKSTITTAPTATPNANAGTGATCTVSNATDAAGTINLTTTGIASSSGVICDITFNKAYGVAPICSATPTSANAIVDAVIQGVYFTTATTKLTINFANTDAIGRTYNWSYQCIETQ